MPVIYGIKELLPWHHNAPRGTILLVNFWRMLCGANSPGTQIFSVKYWWIYLWPQRCLRWKLTNLSLSGPGVISFTKSPSPNELGHEWYSPTQILACNSSLKHFALEHCDEPGLVLRGMLFPWKLFYEIPSCLCQYHSQCYHPIPTFSYQSYQSPCLWWGKN